MTGSTGEPLAFVLHADSALLERAPIYRDLPAAEDRVAALGRALAASPGFRELGDAVLVARLAAPARLAVVGRFDAAERARLQALSGVVDAALRRLRYVSWSEAERAAAVLAERIVDAVGAADLSRARFLALPRGGLLVLGLLAYLLDLRREQILAVPDPERAGDRAAACAAGPLVIVDDCAFTGLRFGQALARSGDEPVVFAHLYSHPELRAAIRRREPRVVACVAAGDLTDHADEVLGEGRPAWEARWRSRSGDAAFWFGLPDHASFPWSEPDISIWNPETGVEEAPWRVVPPEACLKNRPAAPDRLQVHGAGAGPLRLAAGVVFARLADAIVVADCAAGTVWELDGVAADMWTALLAGGGVAGAAAALEDSYDVDPRRLRADAEALAGRALDLGLLERPEAVGDTAP